MQVTRVSRMSDGFSITARDSKKETAGQITLTFTNAPLALQGWSVTDAQGRATRVALSGLQAAPGLDPNLFVLKDPPPEERRPRQDVINSSRASVNVCSVDISGRVWR